MCFLIIVHNDSDKATDKEYFDLLSRGGLTVPSRQMVEFVCACFTILEYADLFIIKNHESTKRASAEQVSGIYSSKYSFTCEKNIEKWLIFAIKIVANIFDDNEPKISSDEVRKNTVECFEKKANVQRKSILKKKSKVPFTYVFVLLHFLKLIFVCLAKIVYYFIINFLEKTFAYFSLF